MERQRESVCSFLHETRMGFVCWVVVFDLCYS